MGETTHSIEYSVFGIDNPFIEQVPVREEAFVDEYLWLSPNAETAGTIKVRKVDGQRRVLKHKQRLQTDACGLEHFVHEAFTADPRHDPLKSWLALYGIGDDILSDPIAIIAKTRFHYDLGAGVHAVYSDIDIGDKQNTNLTLSGRSEAELCAAVDKLAPRLGNARNKSYWAFLQEYAESLE